MRGEDLLREMVINGWTFEQLLMRDKLRAESEVARLNHVVAAKDEQIATLVRILGRNPLIQHARLS